jgi:hypothetical protein
MIFEKALAFMELARASLVHPILGPGLVIGHF